MNLLEELDYLWITNKGTDGVTTKEEIINLITSARERLRKQLCLSMWPEENRCVYKNPCKGCMALDEELGENHISKVGKKGGGNDPS